ncbi:MAG: hypothetical protein V4754_11250 [Pseudomonadota bacterium]
MAREQTLRDLAQQLNATSGAGNWAALAASERMLAQQLPALAARGPWSAAERVALEALRAAHGRAYEQCSVAKDKLGVQLSEMQANKEGWIAYALNGASDLDGNPA